MKPGVGPCPGCGAHVQRTKSRVFNAHRGAGSLIHFCPKATTMTEPTAPPAQPSFWDEFSGDTTDFQRVPEGERGAGSPLILDPAGSGNVRQYKRATYYICAVEDDYGIQQWKRHLTVDHALTWDAAAAQEWDDADWSAKLRLCHDAFVAAGGEVKANNGTARHAHTDLLDQGKPLPDTLTQADHDDLTAYQNAVAPLTLVDVEARTSSTTTSASPAPPTGSGATEASTTSATSRPARSTSASARCRRRSTPGRSGTTSRPASGRRSTSTRTGR